MSVTVILSLLLHDYWGLRLVLIIGELSVRADSKARCSAQLLRTKNNIICNLNFLCTETFDKHAQHRLLQETVEQNDQKHFLGWFFGCWTSLVNFWCAGGGQCISGVFDRVQSF